MKDNNDFGTGVMATIFALVVLVVAFWLGTLVEAASIRSDCADFGKVKILNFWHECSRMDEQK